MKRVAAVVMMIATGVFMAVTMASAWDVDAASRTLPNGRYGDVSP